MHYLLTFVEDGALAEVQRLVGQDPRLLNAKDYDGRTPLMRASQSGQVEVVRWLLDRGVDVNEDLNEEVNGWQYHGNTALCLASSAGHTPVVRLLLERGGDPTIANNGWVPLIEASRWGHLATVRCLLDHPSAAATVNRRERDQGRTALYMACSRGHAGVVKALLEKGADLTIADTSGYTPMGVLEGQADPTAYVPGLFHRLAKAREPGRSACVELLEVRCSLRPFLPPHLLTGLIEAWGLVFGVAAKGGAGLPALEGPAGGGCGRKFRSTRDGGEDAWRDQASARGGSAGGAEGACGGRGH
jgi:hypothetical protein